MYTTTSEFVGFIVFWVLTLPLLWIPPEKFRRPFQFISIYTGIALLSICEWYIQPVSSSGPCRQLTSLDSGLVISQSKGRRFHLLCRTKHQPITLVSLLVNHGRHQLVHRGSSRWDDERIRFLAICQEQIRVHNRNIFVFVLYGDTCVPDRTDHDSCVPKDLWHRLLEPARPVNGDHG
jgi:hypothetical protein